MDEAMMQKVLSSNHHKNLLSEMYKFIEAESLTDVTFICQSSKSVHAHRKVLLHSSSLFRKIVNLRPKDERLVVVMDDVPRDVMTSFLALVYKGEARQIDDQNIQKVNQVCHLLGCDLAAIKLNKTAPKESPLRKKRVLLGGESVVLEKRKDEEPISSKKEPVNSDKKRLPTKKNKDAVQSTQTKYCLCREPERPGMIGCDYCDEWYHTSCLNLTKDDAKKLTKRKWKCPKCELSESKQMKAMESKRKISVSDDDDEEDNSSTQNKRLKSAPQSRSSSSDSSSSSASSSSSSSSSSADSSETPAQVKKPKLLPRNGSSEKKLSPVPRRNSSEELFFW